MNQSITVFSKRPSARDATGALAYRVHTTTSLVHNPSCILGVHTHDTRIPWSSLVNHITPHNQWVRNEPTVDATMSTTTVLASRGPRIRRPTRVANAHKLTTHARTQTPARDSSEHHTHSTSSFDVAFADATPFAARRADERRRGGVGGRRADDVDHGYGGTECGACSAGDGAMCAQRTASRRMSSMRMGATKRRLNEHFFGILSRRTRDSRLTM